MDETNFLDDADDKYADRQVELCKQCNLPKTIVTYETGFILLQEELTVLREELKQLVAKIDTLDHTRNIRRAN